MLYYLRSIQKYSLQNNLSIYLKIVLKRPKKMDLGLVWALPLI